MNSTKTLLKKIERFLRSHKMTQSRFGTEAVQDSGLVTKLRDGRSPSLKVADRIEAYMRKQERQREKV